MPDTYRAHAHSPKAIMTDIVTAKFLLQGATAVGRGTLIHQCASKKTFQAELTGASGSTATIALEGSNTGGIPVVLGTVTLTLPATPSDGFAHDGPWAVISANVLSISGAGATVTAAMGA